VYLISFSKRPIRRSAVLRATGTVPSTATQMSLPRRIAHPYRTRDLFGTPLDRLNEKNSKVGFNDGIMNDQDL
jgi:hypothetical protein